MKRVKLTARITPDLNDGLRRLAALEDRSVSDVVEDAIGRAFATAGRDAEHAVIVAKLDSLSRRLSALDRSVETLFELSAHATRFAMSIAPAISEADRAVLDARGSERFRNIVAAIVTRLAKGRSVWREHFASTSESGSAAPVRESDLGIAAE